MPYTISNFVGAQAIADASSVRNHPLGTIVRGVGAPATGYNEQEATFIYLRGVASVAVGNLVNFCRGTWIVERNPETAGNNSPLAVAMSAALANMFGGFQLTGIAVISKTAVSIAADVALFQSETVGAVEAVASNGLEIVNCRSANTTSISASATLIPAMIMYPHMQGQAT